MIEYLTNQIFNGLDWTYSFLMRITLTLLCISNSKNVKDNESGKILTPLDTPIFEHIYVMIQ